MPPGEIYAPLGITHEELRQRLLEAGIAPTPRRIADVLRIIRVDARSQATNSLVDYIQHVDMYLLDKKRDYPENR